MLRFKCRYLGSLWDTVGGPTENLRLTTLIAWWENAFGLYHEVRKGGALGIEKELAPHCYE